MIQIEKNNNNTFWALVWMDGKGMSRLTDSNNQWAEFETARKAKNAAKKYYKENPFDFDEYCFE